MKTVTILFLFIIFTLTIFAQSGTIKGKVVDKETGEILVGANVLISGTALGAATDVEGNYIIKNVANGLYSVFATFVGYTKMVRDSIIVQSNSTFVNFELELDSTSNDIIILDRPTRVVRSCEPPYDFLKPKGLYVDTLFNNPKRHMPVNPVQIK
jgi:hypothetical protein